LSIAPHATLVERDDVGHFPEIEDPAWFEGLLKQFLKDNPVHVGLEKSTLP